MMDDKKCPYPHFIDTLYGVTPTPIEELPQTCMGCGEPITYADEVCFVSHPETKYEPNDVIEETEISISEGYTFDMTSKTGEMELTHVEFMGGPVGGKTRILDYSDLRFQCDCVDVAMGSFDNQVTLPTPQCLKDIGSTRESVCVDTCLSEEIQSLWDKGIVTTGCCCGHNLPGPSGMPYIGVMDEDIPKMKEMGYIVAPNPCRPGDEDSFYPKSLKRTATNVEGLWPVEVKLINNLLEQRRENRKLITDRIESSKPVEREPVGMEALETPEGRERLARLFTAPMLNRNMYMATDPDGTRVVFGAFNGTFMILRPER